MVKWAISSTRWPDGEEYDGARLRTVRQWLEGRQFYSRRTEARRRRERTPKASLADVRALSTELREEEEFEKAWRTHGADRSHAGRRKVRDAALERQRH